MTRNWWHPYLWLTLAVCCCGLLGCKRQGSEAPNPQPHVPAPKYETVQLVQAPVELLPLEVAGDALPIWRRYAAQRPSLLLLSADPMLTPLPEAVREPAAALLNTGSDDELLARSRPWRADPLVLPSMTIDAALRAGWFAQLVWALPVPDPQVALSPATFLQQMHEGGFLAKGEGVGFGIVGNRLRGTLRNVPFTAAALPNLEAMPGPTIVHIDLSYWQTLHKNERATPLLGLLRETLRALQAQKIPVLAVTVSLGNRDQRIALELRGVVSVLDQWFRQPSSLDAPPSAAAQDLATVLQLGAPGSPGLPPALSARLQERGAGAAALNYGLYQAALSKGDGVEAINHLSRAVRLDKAYAMEYLQLATRAVDAGNVDEALRLLDLAQDVYPDDLRIKLIQLQLAVTRNDRTRMALLLDALRAQPWSPVYFPEMPDYLKSLGENQRPRS